MYGAFPKNHVHLETNLKLAEVTFEPRPQREEDEEDEEDEEEDRGRKMTMSQVCNDILRFFKESGVDKKSNGYYSQIWDLKRAGKVKIDNHLWRILKPEVKEIYSELFRKKVSTRR